MLIALQEMKIRSLTKQLEEKEDAFSLRDETIRRMVAENDKKRVRVNELEARVEELSLGQIRLQDQLRRSHTDNQNSSHVHIWKEYLNANGSAQSEGQVRDIKNSIKLRQLSTWRIGISGDVQLCATSNHLVAVRGQMPLFSCPYATLRVFDGTGQQISNFPTKCTHNEYDTLYKLVAIKHKGKSMIAEHCSFCRKIRVFNTNLKIEAVYNDIEIAEMCKGKDGSIIVANLNSNALEVLCMDNEGKSLINHGMLMHLPDLDPFCAMKICFDINMGIVIIANIERNSIAAYGPSDDGFTRLWVSPNEINCTTFHVSGICSDNHGCVYLASERNGTILAIDAQTGAIMELNLSGEVDLGTVNDIDYCDERGALVVRHRGDSISIFADTKMNITSCRQLHLNVFQ